MAAREEATVKFVAVCAGLEKNRGERKSCEEHFNAYKACKEQDVRASPPTPKLPLTHTAGAMVEVGRAAKGAALN